MMITKISNYNYSPMKTQNFGKRNINIVDKNTGNCIMSIYTKEDLPELKETIRDVENKINDDPSILSNSHLHSLLRRLKEDTRAIKKDGYHIKLYDSNLIQQNNEIHDQSELKK